VFEKASEYLCKDFFGRAKVEQEVEGFEVSQV